MAQEKKEQAPKDQVPTDQIQNDQKKDQIQKDQIQKEQEAGTPSQTEQETMDPEEGNLKGRIEAILFVSGEAVDTREMAKALRVTSAELQKALGELKDEYDYGQRGFTLKIYGEKVQLATRSLYARDVVRLLQPVQMQSLSQAAMETLAVVAYKQPVTRAEVEQIRGVKCDYSLQSLTAKGLIAEVGRKETIGRPILFGTTDEFLSRFGIESLEKLPPLPEPETREEDDTTEEGSEELIP